MLGRIRNFMQEEREKKERAALMELKARYHAFRIFLDNNGRALELIVDIDGQLISGRETELRPAVKELMGVCSELVDGLNLLANDRYAGLYTVQGEMAVEVLHQLDKIDKRSRSDSLYCIALDDPAAADPARFGNKAAELAKLKSLGLPVPDGFGCSTAACRDFLSTGGLANEIRMMLKKVESGRAELSAVAENIREMIVDAPLPASISEALAEAYERLGSENSSSDDRFSVSVRSSGVSEDGREFSFAGQYASILNVQGIGSLLKAYREVIASGFSARAVSYRRNAGMPAVDLDLAVLFQVMLNPYCAGVMFTHDPSQPDSGRMMISAVPGLGKSAVDGSAPADIYRPRRVEQVCEPDLEFLRGDAGERSGVQVDFDQLMDGASIPHKTTSEVAEKGGGTKVEPFAPEKADLALLPQTALVELVRLGEIIESLEKSAQDVEWAWSETGGISILQARPLRLAAVKDGQRLKVTSVSAPLITGTCASSGRAVGQISASRSADDLHRLQEQLADSSSRSPLILVLPQSIVDAAPLIKYCSGVIIDIGNPTDHLSCIAREYGIPMITGAENALSCLREGEWIIVDADRGAIFRAPESVRAKSGSHPGPIPGGQKTKGVPRRDADARETVKSTGTSGRERLRKMIVPLNLTDEFGPTFSFKECRSVHDIIRYTHEMAVLSMFDAGDRVMEDAGNLLHPIEIGIPFSFLVIDLGGGIRQRRDKSLLDRLSPRNPVEKDEILSVPLQALCEGLTDPQINWHSSPDAGAISGIVSRTMLDSRGRRPAGSFNYALTARDYLNLNVRMEFHFAMLDAVCGRNANANYIRFRFKGGGASAERSRRRALFLQQVLEKNAFYTSVAGDLVTASLMGASKESVYDRLVMLGHLFGFSRFLDGVMTDDRVPNQLARQFLDGNFSTRSVMQAETGST